MFCTRLEPLRSKPDKQLASAHPLLKSNYSTFSKGSIMPTKLTGLGGRRFLLTLGCGIATTVLTWYNKIDGGVYATVLIATVAAYIGGNTTQKIQESKVENQ
jgi:hypothetical protein